MTVAPARRLTRPLIAALVLATLAGAALAKPEVTDPIVRERVEAMQLLKLQTGILGDMAAGKLPYDAAKAQEAAAAILATADAIEPLYEERALDPASDALPEIWNAPGEFRQKANRLYKAAMGVDAGSAKAIAGSMQALGAACKDCHGRFRQ
ncbi:MAG: cytochrome c [Sphingomonadales bacterium]|nr:cytochrome c [Sphingomonadales bacterium]